MMPVDPFVSWISVCLIVAFVLTLRTIIVAMRRTEIDIRDLNREIQRMDYQHETKKRKSHLSQAGIEMWIKRNFKRRKGIRR